MEGATDPLDYRDPEWVAEQLGMDKNTLYKHLQAGQIPAVRLGRKWLISEGELARFLAERTRAQTQIRKILSGGHLTARAARVVEVAHERARALGHPYVGQEHILDAITRVEGNLALRMLEGLGVSADSLRAALAKPLTPHSGAGDDALDPELTARAERSVILAAHEFENLGHASYVGAEHFLLGILAAGEGVGYTVLTSLGLTLEKTRQEFWKQVFTHMEENRRAGKQQG